MRPVLKYPGAKNRLTPWIIDYIPEHKVYVEPFAGSLAVLFAKERSHIETVNDINQDIVNFFRILRDQPEELKGLLQYTPYSRKEYELAYEPAEDPMERARRFAVKCWMSFAAGNRYKNGFKNGQQGSAPNPARAWAMLPETSEEAAKRLAGVQIECLPALELVQRYHSEDVFLYLDPPYLSDARNHNLYQYEMMKADHEELLQVIQHHPGKILISGYENNLYDEELKGWEKVQKQTTAENGASRTETLWMNYEIGQLRLDL